MKKKLIFIILLFLIIGFGIGYIVFGSSITGNAGKIFNLKPLPPSITFDEQGGMTTTIEWKENDELTGKTISRKVSVYSPALDSVIGPDASGITCSGTCNGGDCIVQGCTKTTNGGVTFCEPCSCDGGCGCTCTKSSLSSPSQN
jgi:hypothetical protein